MEAINLANSRKEQVAAECARFIRRKLSVSRWRCETIEPLASAKKVKNIAHKLNPTLPFAPNQQQQKQLKR